MATEEQTEDHAEEHPEDYGEEHDGESALSRSLRPLLMLAPLTLAVIVPASIYGWYSSQAANDAFSFVEAALIVDSDGTTVDQASFCAGVPGEVSALSFHELAENLDEARASLSNLGFGAAIVDFKGWLDEPLGPGEDDGSDSSTTDQDLRDDITFSVVRSESDQTTESGDESSWCIDDIDVRQ